MAEGRRRSSGGATSRPACPGVSTPRAAEVPRPGSRPSRRSRRGWRDKSPSALSPPGGCRRRSAPGSRRCCPPGRSPTGRARGHPPPPWSSLLLRGGMRFLYASPPNETRGAEDRMGGSQSDLDVLVIGAGAAGLAAGHRVTEAAGSVLVAEARDRIGGRAQTVPTRLGQPVDLGCEWLHSADRNPWTSIAHAMGFSIDRNLPDWGSRIAGSRGQAAQQEWARVYAEFDRRVDEVAAAPDDLPASALLPPDGRWNALINAISTWANGVQLDRLSVQDHARYADSGINWRILEGYGSLIAAYGAAVPVRLGTVAEPIHHGAARITVGTSRGDLRARAVIVTVPTTVLAAEAIRFMPALPDKIAAAQGLPLGIANKLFLALSGPPAEFPVDHHVLGSPDRTATGSYQLRPHAWPMIAGYFGGDLAVALERDGGAGMTAFARGPLPGSVSKITAASSSGFDDAVRGGLERASRTLRGITGLHIVEQKAKVHNGRIEEFRVTMEVTFVLDD